MPKILKPVITYSLLFISTIAFSQNLNNKYSVAIEKKAISIMANDVPVIAIDSISFNYVAPASLSVIYRSGDSTIIDLRYVGVPEFNMIDGALNHTVRLTITRSDGSFHFSANAPWAGRFTLHLADKNDHYFGLAEGLFPDNRKSPDLRGQVIDVEVNGNMYRMQENFTSIWSAFYYNPKGYASFVNTFAKGRYQLGINGTTQIEHETGTLDWYIFTGASDKIYREYYTVIGRPKFVPLWACGPMVWRDENRKGSAEILQDAAEFSKLHIPLTSLMIDRPYSNGAHLWSKMDFNSNFANPEHWIKTLDSLYGLRLITWIAPATFSDTNFPARLPGSFNYFDLTNPQAVAEFGNRLKTSQYAAGVKGHKMDRGDENFPTQESWYDGTPEAERKNKYVYLYAKVTDSLLRQAWGSDHLNYARAAFQGSQQYLTGVWGGDPRSGWDGMASNMANAIRASFMGFPNWGTDVGGYLGPTGKIPDTLYIRWLQWGVFNGLFEVKIDGAGGGGEDRAPWHCSNIVQEIFRQSCEQRIDLLPHIFSKLNSSGKYGPLMKPLSMVYPGDTSTYPIWDEYIFGDAILIAPIFSAENRRNIYLPEGEWMDFYTHEKLRGGKTITVNAPLAHIPAYVKSNSFLLTGDIYKGNKKAGQPADISSHIDIIFHPGMGKAEFDFIDAQQENKKILFTAVVDDKKINLIIPAISYAGTIKIFADTKPKEIFINKKKIKTVYENDFVMINREANKNFTVEIIR